MRRMFLRRHLNLLMMEESLTRQRRRPRSLDRLRRHGFVALTKLDFSGKEIFTLTKSFQSSSSFKVSISCHKVFRIMYEFLQVCGCLPGAAIAGCSLERRETCLTQNSRGRPEFLHWPGQQEVSPKSSIDTMMTRQMETLNKLSNSLNALFTIVLNK